MKYIIPVMPLLLGFAADAILGDPHSLPHPVRLIGRLISRLEKLVRAKFKNLRAGGMVLAAVVLFLSSVVPLAILAVCYRINLFLGIAAESVMCCYLTAAKCLRDESMKVYDALAENDIEKSRKALSMIVGRDTAKLDEEGVIKAAVETVAENASDGAAAPILYMAAGGAVLGFFYKAANTMDSMIGYKNEKYTDLGRFAAKLDDVLNYIPSRLTALAMVLSAFILRMDGKGAYRIWRRDRRKHPSPNSAQTEAACAGALGIQLGGDSYYSGILCKKERLGDPVRAADKEDIRRANRLMYCATVIVLTVSAAARSLIIGGLL